MQKADNKSLAIEALAGLTLDRASPTEGGMMRKLLLVAMVLALLVAAAPGVGARPDTRPFKGSMRGSVTFPLDDTCPTLRRTDSQATGNGSHLGRTTMTSAHCTPGAGTIEGGDMTLAAANGDEVYIKYQGFAGPPNVDGIVIADVVFEIVGGGGRFDGARGGGEMTAYIVFEGFDDPEWAARWVWSGTIGY